MYVRLAFAVAAHLEPEILIVDEVLAVGDAQFQKKCLGKMQDVARNSGRTVIFVSHDLSAVNALTSRCIYLKAGTVCAQGPTAEVIADYTSVALGAHFYEASPTAQNHGGRIVGIRLLCSVGPGVQEADSPIEIRFELEALEPLTQSCLSFQIVNHLQQPATHVWLYHTDSAFCQHTGRWQLVCRIPRLRLNVGRFTIKAYFSAPPGGSVWDTVEGACPFEVIRSGPTILWGWRPDVGVYHEDFSWQVKAP